LAVIKVTPQAAAEAKDLELEFNSAALAGKGFADFMKDVVTKTKGSSDSLAKLFGNVRALTPVLALAGKAGDEFTDILVAMEQKSGATEEAFRTLSKTSSFQMDQLKASVTVLAQELGRELLPTLNRFIQFMLSATKEGGGVSVMINSLRTMRNLILSLVGALAEFQAANIEELKGFGTRSKEGLKAMDDQIAGLKGFATAMDEAVVINLQVAEVSAELAAALELASDKLLEETKAAQAANMTLDEYRESQTEAGIAAAEAAPKIAKLIEGLQKQADTLGMNSAQVKAYTLTLLNADDATLRLAADLQEEIKVFNERAEVLKENERANAALRQETEDLAKATKDEVQAVFNETRTAAERYAIELERIRALQQEGLGADTAARKIKLLDKELEDATKQTEELNKAAERMGNVFASAFEDAVIGGKNFSDILQALLQDIQRIILRMTVTEPLQKGVASFLTGIAGGLFGGGGSSSIITAASGGKAHGGRISGPALVGERGLELFIPDSAGKIVRNDQIGGGGGVTINQTIEVDARGSEVSREDLSAAVEEGARRGHLLIINDFMRNGQARRLI